MATGRKAASEAGQSFEPNATEKRRQLPRVL
jgi:hypothetical protein